MINDLYALSKELGIHNMQRGVGPKFKRFMKDYSARPLFSPGFWEAFGKGQPASAMQQLRSAADDIERHEKLHALTLFLVHDLCALPLRLSYADYEAMTPSAAMENADLYSFILLLACIAPSFERLRALGVPETYYKDTALNCAEQQMKKFVETGDGSVADFPWDRNFYTCGIFRLGRFLFKLECLWNNVTVFRRGKETIAFYAENCRVRKDGQLDGVNGQFDEHAFKAVFEENAVSVSGYPINPAGFITTELVTLAKKEWKQVLKEDDVTLGLHIPSGSGYNVENLRKDCAEAYAFFSKWFPAKKIKAFHNESWLNDPHLSALLGGEGNIAQMQQQMYLYPLAEGDTMSMQELFPAGLPAPEGKMTRLQQAAQHYLQRGGKLTGCGMLILPEDIPRLGENPYAADAVYKEAWQKYAQV